MTNNASILSLHMDIVILSVELTAVNENTVFHLGRKMFVHSWSDMDNNKKKTTEDKFSVRFYLHGLESLNSHERLYN